MSIVGKWWSRSLRGSKLNMIEGLTSPTSLDCDFQITLRDAPRYKMTSCGKDERPASSDRKHFSAVDATAIEASAAGRGQRLAVPIASDDQEALQVAEQLVPRCGM
jgi:hypothetical protein